MKRTWNALLTTLLVVIFLNVVLQNNTLLGDHVLDNSPSRNQTGGDLDVEKDNREAIVIAKKAIEKLETFSEQAVWQDNLLSLYNPLEKGPEPPSEDLATDTGQKLKVKSEIELSEASTLKRRIEALENNPTKCPEPVSASFIGGSALANIIALFALIATVGFGFKGDK
jgi:hypothetical protein